MTAELVKLESPPTIDEVHTRVCRALDGAVGNLHRANMLALCTRYMLIAGREYVSNLSIALIALKPEHAAAFDKDLAQLYNYTARLLNQVRACHGLLPLTIPPLPNEVSGNGQ